MSTTPHAPRSPLRVFLAILALDAVIGLLLFLAGCAVFLRFTLPMDNDFATYAREHHVGLAVAANVRTLPGYALLALAFALLAHPLVGRRPCLVRPRGRGDRFRGVGLVLATNLALFLASLGVANRQSPTFLDTLSRYVSPFFPRFDPYPLYDWHVLDVLAVLFVLASLWAAVFHLRKPLGFFRRHPRTAGAVLAAALGTGALLASQAPGPHAGRPRPARPHVLILAADSLRASNLGCYGYGRATSPAIDRLAGEGILLESLHVGSASTLESWTTTLTSQFPVTHGLRYMFPSKERVQRVSGSTETLPRILGRLGYHTAVSSNWVGNCFSLVDFGFAANRASAVQNLDVFIAEAALIAHPLFPIYFNNRLGERLYPQIRQVSSYLNPGALRDRLVEEFERALDAGRPFFGVLFESTTHLPFAASHPFNLRWVDRDYVGPNRYQIDFEVDGFIQAGFRDALTPDQVRHIVDLYDGCVSEFDHDVAEVLAWLEEEGLADETIVIVTSDHGDDLYEAGTTLGHGTSFFGGDQTTRIPFVLRLPDRRHGGLRLPQVARTVDVAPTLLDLLGVKAPETFEGDSLVRLFDDPAAESGRPAFAETCYLFFPKKVPGEDVLRIEGANQTLEIDPGFDRNLVLKEEFHDAVIATKDRMIRTPRWKLLHIPGRRGPIYRLYDVVQDPGQTRDLAGERPDVVRRLAAALDAYWAGETRQRWTHEDDRP